MANINKLGENFQRQEFIIYLINSISFLCVIFIGTIFVIDSLIIPAVLLFLLSCIFIINFFYFKFLIKQHEEEIELLDEEFKAFTKEEEITHRLLLNIFPTQIIDRLLKNPKTVTRHYSNATVLFADLVGFTTLAHNTSSKELVRILNEIFSGFDDLTEKHSLEKIKTIGDAYMLAAGIPTTNDNHANDTVHVALDMKKFLNEFNKKNGLSINLRIGINSGPLIAGIIGKKKFLYDLWGDTVNVASRMESHSLPGQIQISQSTYKQLDKSFNLKKRGEIEVKGKGIMKTYFVLGSKNK